MDKLERKSVRSFFGDINIPNMAIMGEHKLSARVWRMEVMHLAGWVRRLGSADTRVKQAALLVSRDAGRYLGLVKQGRPFTEPRFFDFTEHHCEPIPEGLLGMPARYACLAAR